eukprot:46435_1
MEAYELWRRNGYKIHELKDQWVYPTLDYIKTLQQWNLHTGVLHIVSIDQLLLHHTSDHHPFIIRYLHVIYFVSTVFICCIIKHQVPLSLISIFYTLYGHDALSVISQPHFLVST